MSTRTADGGSTVPDRRRHAWRSDLAAEQLRGMVDAPAFVTGRQMQVRRSSVAMRDAPDAARPFSNEALFGEAVQVYDVAGGWAWIQLERDGYVGYVPADVLSTDAQATTHRVQSLGTFIYPEPDIKAPPLMALSLNAKLAVAEQLDKFSRLATGGYVISRHLTEHSRAMRDFVEVAERFVGVPYLWGGRTRLGLDCSGLVQLALEAAGHDAPRDSDMQQAEVGDEVLVPERLEGLQRGDLVFWKGHVGILVDAYMMIHANAHHMSVVIEPLEAAARRASRNGSDITAIKRPVFAGQGASA